MEFQELSEQREQQEQRDGEAPSPAAAPEAAAKPRGRPFAKGRSGNPKGRPRGLQQQAALVTSMLIAEQAVPLTQKLIRLALGGDRAALRLCLEYIVPRRREAPIELLPQDGGSLDFGAATLALIDAAANGEITSVQAETLVRTMAAARRAVETPASRPAPGEPEAQDPQYPQS